MNRQTIETWFKKLQDDICTQIESTDQKGAFEQDLWQRPQGGGGRTRILRNGNIIEKGGVNFSAVEGPTPQKILDALQLDQADFYATGVSIVMHPRSPRVPIIHMNVRYFEMSNGVSWFGGGIDLTPHYVVDEDAHYFHQQLKTTCDQHDPSYYPQFKQWADDYFYIKHRKETRGIGGIFFDRLTETPEISLADRWAFVQDVGSLFAPTYCHLLDKNKDLPFGENEKLWQYLRRGRYVEFNLVLDKGTKFGLDTDGRTESILMSMPPQANWEYNYEVQPGSEEEKTLRLLQKGVNWI
ncbi:coproporphyrinogen III oxidase [Reichenbachiella sp. 5M10]|uniref:oxygen-dependent coproporphyrinogen oxidase n=1 Tax=Reichenbachiella sp. 5M10 TaxID=1889772 RepID=UPI000C16181A|nr:oxygen-dependent coproporphyrinogen oxidase [Reichenbachiella sp. 5M10]PIB34349.1 coproporphyrinogen III oxidase [Reichenbachiella sp. 5M10]